MPSRYLPSVMKMALVLRPRAIFMTSGKYLPIRTSRPVNNIYILNTSHVFLHKSQVLACFRSISFILPMFQNRQEILMMHWHFQRSFNNIFLIFALWYPCFLANQIASFAVRFFTIRTAQPDHCRLQITITKSFKFE